MQDSNCNEGATAPEDCSEDSDTLTVLAIIAIAIACLVGTLLCVGGVCVLVRACNNHKDAILPYEQSAEASSARGMSRKEFEVSCRP